ncbi:MAG: hypothetical protein IT372_21580 [Polyangiaceae bacterium]|nr:hypothetical protein [Polyangiaceae bacterium]
MSARDTSTPRKDSKLRKLLRLGAYCITVGALGIGLALGSAYGSVKDATLELGSELGKLDGAGSSRPILLNGEPIFVASAVDDVKVDELLDRVEARCRENPIGIAAELPKLPAEARALLETKLASRSSAGIIRHQGGGKGMVACFMRSDASSSVGSMSGMADTIRRIAAVAETGDLSKLGNVRYVFAEPTANGRTHVVTAWTDGSFNLYSMLPQAGGDAPGSDLDGVPRPNGATRLLTATIDKVPYSLRIYDAPSSPGEVLAQYDQDLARRGWQKVMGGTADHPVAVYDHPGVQLYVIPSRDRERTMVTLIQMPGR